MGAPSVDFSVIFSKDNRKGTHPPDLCLQGAGEGIIAKSTLLVTGVEGHGDIECRRARLHGGQEEDVLCGHYNAGTPTPRVSGRSNSSSCGAD